MVEREKLYYLKNVSQQTHKGTLALRMNTYKMKTKRKFGYGIECNISDFICETCVMAKSHRVVFPLSNKKTKFPFSLIHTDVWGPAPQSTHNGKKWFINFIDDCTRITWVFFLKHKSDVCNVFRSFHHMIVTQFNTHIQVIRSDNGGNILRLS